MFVSIHIPKTAGTAVAKIFDDSSYRRIMYDYGSERGEEVRICPDATRKHRDFIAAHFKYLHGHFHYLKYADVFANSPFIATVRNPVDRVISQYSHIARSGDRNLERHRVIMSGEMGLVEFSEREDIGNAQWHYLEGRRIKDYDFIFVQEHLEESLKKFCARFELTEVSDYLSWAGVPEINRNPNPIPPPSMRSLFTRPKGQLTRKVLRQISRNCERDNEVYHQALECLKER